MDYTPTIKHIVEVMAKAFGEQVPYDQTFSAVVEEKVNNHTYKVKHNNDVLAVSSFDACNVGDYVWVCIPSGVWADAFVVSKKPVRNTKSGEVPSTAANFLVNDKYGVVGK